MKIKRREPAEGCKDVEICLGIASWDDGDGTEKSAKYAWKDKNGHVARGGEVPVEALRQMLDFAIRCGYARPEQRKKSS